MLPEGIFNLSCELPDRTIDDIEKEFELQSLRRYLDEASKIREDKLRKYENKK